MKIGIDEKIAEVKEKLEKAYADFIETPTWLTHAELNHRTSQYATYSDVKRNYPDFYEIRPD